MVLCFLCPHAEAVGTQLGSGHPEGGCQELQGPCKLVAAAASKVQDAAEQCVLQPGSCCTHLTAQASCSTVGCEPRLRGSATAHVLNVSTMLTHLEFDK